MKISILVILQLLLFSHFFAVADASTATDKSKSSKKKGGKKAGSSMRTPTASPIYLPPPSPPPTPPPTPSPPPTSSAVALDESGFFVVPDSVIQGSDVVLTFTVVPGSAISSSVVLRTGSGEIIGNAVDDGSLTSGDQVAGDGIFTNSFAFNFQESGSASFTATIDDIVYTAQIGIRDGTNIASTSQAEDIFANFYDILLNKTTTESLDQVYNQMMTNPPSNIQQSSISLTEGDFPSITWTTNEGLIEAIVPDFPAAIGEAVDWQPIVFGDTFVGFDSPEGGRSRTLSTEKEDRFLLRTRNLDEVAPPPSFLDCIDAIEISFFGMEESNFLTEVAEEAGLSSDRIERHTNACGGFLGVFCRDDPLEILRDLHQYAIVSIVSLSRVINYKLRTGAPRREIALITDVNVKRFASRYAADFAAKRLISVNGYVGVLPSFFEKYTGTFDGGVVYVGGSKTSSADGFSGVFQSKQVGAFFGHQDVWQPADVWVSLFSGGTAGNTPCVADGNCDLSTGSYSLLDLCELGDIPNLIVEYTWPINQLDLDTGTEFLGGQVGYACAARTDYLNWPSGDDTSGGGKETIIVNLQKALDDGVWEEQGGTIVDLRAGWFSPAFGIGPATVSIRFSDGTSVTSLQTIAPGSQDSCAQTCVGSVSISLFPRLRASLSVEQSSCGVVSITPAPTPPQMTGPNSCQENNYGLVDFSNFGPTEVALGVLTFLTYPAFVLSIKGILEETNQDARGLANAQFPGFGCRNDVCDAFRHSYFNYRVTTQLNQLVTWTDTMAVLEAKKWGDAHERTAVNDFPERMMDLFNNDVGRRLAIERPNTTRDGAIRVIRDAINEGLLTLQPITDCG